MSAFAFYLAFSGSILAASTTAFAGYCGEVFEAPGTRLQVSVSKTTSANEASAHIEGYVQDVYLCPRFGSPLLTGALDLDIFCPSSEMTSAITSDFKKIGDAKLSGWRISEDDEVGLAVTFGHFRDDNDMSLISKEAKIFVPKSSGCIVRWVKSDSKLK